MFLDLDGVRLGDYVNPSAPGELPSSSSPRTESEVLFE